MRHAALLTRAAFAVALGLPLPLFAAEPRAKLEFNRDIRPILSNNCYHCHGPDAKTREGGLRLDQRDGATATLESGGVAIVPENVAASELVARITASDPDLQMPPKGSGKSLTPEQVETLKRWVAEGAEYQGHWSLITPKRPETPAVKHGDWARNEIDRFVLAKLEAQGLSPSGEADRATLIRRVTFDLTGLPPTPAEVAAFLGDPSPDAYERLVDRLLESPRFGEHMARYWLDAARYGDTHGLHLDNERSMWPYREWVINALNDNKPFDQFTIEQLGGDLLPNPTVDQRVATGFNRCNVTTGEGGSINEEVLVRYATDRTEAFGTVWMGLTLGCAVCHDHKFDPISQKEFYQLYAFFNSISDQAMDGNALLPPPVLKLPTAEQNARIAELDGQMAAANKDIQDALAKAVVPEPTLDGPADVLGVVRQDYVWVEDAVPTGAQAQANAGGWKFVTKDQGPVYSGLTSHTRTAAGLDQHFFTGAAGTLKVGAGDRFFAYVYLDPKNLPETIMLQFNDGSWEHRTYWGADKIPFGAGDTPGHRHGGALPAAGQWVRLEADAAAMGLMPGSTINGFAFTQFGGTVHWDHAGITTLTPQGGGSYPSQLAWENYERQQGKSTLPGEIQNLIKLDADKRNPDQAKQLRNYYVEYVHAETRKTFEPLHQRVEQLKQRRTETENAIAATLVSEDLGQPRPAHILVRGAYDKPADKVERATPAALPPMAPDLPRNRLGLAKWLVDPQHPLTARVTVNRYWQQYFGQGLVKSAGDFGSQAEWPSHPDLLDWLATDFVAKGWNVKAMQKQIVMSATYRQSSKVTPELWQRDPNNELLARGPRFRLDAEMIRDTVLATSGLLVEREGGKSVKTYQPDGIWEAVGFIGSNTREYKRDDGEALYRRSLYTFWKRTAPPPSLMTFDAPSREICTVRRARTNTPLQALVLMNDEQYVEAARALAARMMLDGGAAPQDRLRFAFLRVVGRPPREQEMAILERVLAKQLDQFRRNTAAANDLLSVGKSERPQGMDPVEHAAYTMVANLVLNLDEAITKE